MKRAALLILVLSLSYASLVWEFSTDGATTSKPVLFQGAIVMASDDGNLYALDPATGAKKWQAAVGRRPADMVIADNAIYLAVSGGKVMKLGANGAKQWETDLNRTNNVTRIYGAAVNQKTVYVTADNGVYAIEKNGSLRSRLSYFNESVLSAPAAGADFVVYGMGGQLLRQADSGVVAWRAALPEGSFWQSRPVIEGNVIYVGALDDSMHAYILTNGMEIWSARTRNWVTSTPLVRENVVYFGSNDGNVYAVQGGDGNIIWAAPTQLAVQTQPEYGFMGGREVIFAGGTDKSVYAISKDGGEVVWKGSSTAAAGSPLFYQNKVIFGSEDGKVFAYSTERACSIASPREGDVIGRKEVVVGGKYVSESGDAMVMVQVNGGELVPANITDADWEYFMDPKARLAPGLNIISCQVADSAGSESGPAFTSVSVNHDPEIPLSSLTVTVSPDIMEGEEFTVYVNDGDDGSPVDRFEISFNGADPIRADKNYSTTIGQAGAYDIVVKKIGFEDAFVRLNVRSSGVDPLYLGAGALLIIIIIWQVYTRFLRQRFASKKKK